MGNLLSSHADLFARLHLGRKTMNLRPRQWMFISIYATVLGGACSDYDVFRMEGTKEAPAEQDLGSVASTMEEHSPLNRHFAFMSCQCPVRNITSATNTYTSVSTRRSLYPAAPRVRQRGLSIAPRACLGQRWQRHPCWPHDCPPASPRLSRARPWSRGEPSSPPGTRCPRPHISDA
jgi:hypothetical protein